MDQRKDWVVLVGHLLASDSKKSTFEHLVLNELFIVSQSFVNSLESFTHNVVNDGSLVGGFHLLSGVQEGLSSLVDVDLQVDLFVGQELIYCQKNCVQIEIVTLLMESALISSYEL